MVLGIMALLLSVGVYSMLNVTRGGEEAKAKGDVRAIVTNLIRYQTKSRILPTNEQGLKALVTKPSVAPVPEQWQQMMKEIALMDPWAKEYQYRNPGKRNPDSFDVFSLGKDGKEGTDDDIGNW